MGEIRSGGKSSCSRLKDNMILLDAYGQPFNFMLPGKRKMYKSLVGTIMTLIAVTTVVGYAIYKWNILRTNTQASISTTVEENYFADKNATLTEQDGFKIAFSLTDSNVRNP